MIGWGPVRPEDKVLGVRLSSCGAMGPPSPGHCTPDTWDVFFAMMALIEVKALVWRLHRVRTSAYIRLSALEAAIPPIGRAHPENPSRSTTYKWLDFKLTILVNAAPAASRNAKSEMLARYTLVSRIPQIRHIRTPDVFHHRASI
jgi:hypothetical protein